MASYTDKIPTFNPYVEQQPVDAMLKVGVYKQQKYEEGVKKIQTNIDNVAGLDIANDVQQKYLQSKLNALGNNLTFFAASDFSDFSLVNSVNGMTKQITKDEDIINAVSSTAKLRAGYKKKAELAKKGLTDKNNDDYYDMFASEYVDSKDLKASFNADYVPYTNIVKKLQQALVGAGESTTIAEQIFVTDPNTGKPLITNGKYTYADAKAIDKLVTNKPAVIAAINNVLNEGSVKQQLGIDGWATYRNTEATELLQPLKNDYDSEKVRLEQQSIQISAMLNGTNLSPEEREMYTKAATEVEAALLNNDNTFMSLSKEAEDNPESFKQSYYTQEFKQRLMNQFLKEENSRTYGKNEALEAQMAKDKFAFEKQQEANKIAYQNEMLKIAQDGNMRAWYEFQGNYSIDPITGDVNKKPEPGKGPGSGGTYDANKPLFTAAVPGDKVNAQNIIEEDINKLSEDKNVMAKSLFFDFVRSWKKDSSLDDKDILRMADQWAKQSGVSTEVYLNGWAKDIKNRYDVNGVAPPPNLDDEFNEYYNTASTLNKKMNQTKVLMDASIKEAGVEKELNTILKDKPTLTFTLKNEKFVITPNDMLNMRQSGWLSSLAMGYGGYNRERFSVNDKRLTTNQNRFLSNWYNLSGEMQQQILKESDKYIGASKYYAAKDKAEEIYNKKLAKIVGVTDAVVGTLPFVETDEKNYTIAKVTAYVNSGNRNYASGSDGDLVLKALPDATGVTWVGKKPTNSREQWTGEIKITSKDGPVYTITNVNHDDLQTFTNATFTAYEEKPIQDALNINEKTKSTNPVHMVNSPNAWTTAYFNGAQVNPEVTRQGWAYRADVVKSGGGYRIVNYVRAPKTNQFITIYGDLVYPKEAILDNIYKTTSPVELSYMYLNYLQKQNKQ